MKLSIIVPIYNTEKYLEKCLSSIISQELNENDYEVIIVNDQSPDNCETIVKRYITKYKNFKYFTKDNGGISSARNFGLSKANGKYIYFFDSDDYLEDNTFSKILENLTNEIDCLTFDFKRVDEDGKLIESRICYKSGLYNADKFITENNIFPTVWMYVIRKSLLINNNISFTLGIYHEDEEFVPIMLSFCKKIKKIDLYIYNYRQRPNSIMTSKSMSMHLKKINSLITVLKNIEHRINDCNNPNIKRGLTIRKEQLLISFFKRIKEHKINLKETKVLIKNLSDAKLYPVTINHLSFKNKIKATLINNKYFINNYFK